MAKQKCKYCEYEWDSKIANPVGCPRCHRRFDYPKVRIRNDRGAK